MVSMVGWKDDGNWVMPMTSSSLAAFAAGEHNNPTTIAVINNFKNNLPTTTSSPHSSYLSRDYQDLGKKKDPSLGEWEGSLGDTGIKTVSGDGFIYLIFKDAHY
jgi:hypothetical protein